MKLVRVARSLSANAIGDDGERFERGDGRPQRETIMLIEENLQQVLERWKEAFGQDGELRAALSPERLRPALQRERQKPRCTL